MARRFRETRKRPFRSKIVAAPALPMASVPVTAGGSRGRARSAPIRPPKEGRRHAWLALTYAADYRNQWTGDGAAALDRAFELARTAHQINPDIRETYWVLALVHRDRHQQEQALHYLETAVRLYPSYADAYALMGSIKTYIGRPAEAVPLLLTALRLNPEGAISTF